MGCRNALVIAALSLGCIPTPPGQGPKAERGYARTQPVIAALAEYKRSMGRVPDSLAQLVPTFLPDSALATPKRSQEQYPLEYHRIDSTPYTLQFRYVGPGTNWCAYDSRVGKWKCGGLY